MRYNFGHFQLEPHYRRLTRSGESVPLGGRAFDILKMLVERRGDVVTKDELLSRVWPDTQVVEAALRFQINALRTALGESRDDRYIATLSGRGYGFVAEITEEDADSERPLTIEHPVATARGLDLGPPSPAPIPARGAYQLELIGREDALVSFSQTLLENKFLTIVGVGGVGKTAMAIAIANRLADEFPDGTIFADFATIRDPALVPSVLASLLGLGVFGGDPIPGIVAYLQKRQMLVIFDNCEHVIDVAAATAERLLSSGSKLFIMATSREPLRATGERSRRLFPLATPPAGTDGDAIMGYPSVQLSLLRAGLDAKRIAPAERTYLADICRKLDGIPLAIEFAAARIPDLGLKALSDLLDDALSVLHSSNGGGPDRHQTMRATLEWSYQLLSTEEMTIIRRLSVFSGLFTRSGALAVGTGGNGEFSDFFDHFSDLIFKSMLSADFTGEQEKYTLNTITRTFAREKLAEAADHEEIRRRHAEYCCDVLGHAEKRWEEMQADAWLEDHSFLIGDIRAALAWAHGTTGDSETALKLTVASVYLWLELSLLDEYRMYVERAIVLLQEGMPDPAVESQLMLIYAAILQNTEGGTSKTQNAFLRALQISEAEDDLLSQQRAISGLCAATNTVGMYREGLEWARLFETRFRKVSQAVADRLVGHSLLYMGQFAEARRHVEPAYRDTLSGTRKTRHNGVFYDHRTILATILARSLWVQGFPEQSRAVVAECVEHNLTILHPMSACMSFTVACLPILLLIGDDDEARRVLDVNQEFAIRNSLHQWYPGAQAFRKMMDLRAGKPGPNYENEINRLLWQMSGPVVEAAAIMGDDVTTDALIQKAARADPCWCISELHRAKGTRHQRKGDLLSAEKEYKQALEVSASQGARAFELRAATSFAELLVESGRRNEGRDRLARVFDTFGEGHDTRDVVAAALVLKALS